MRKNSGVISVILIPALLLLVSSGCSSPAAASSGAIAVKTAAAESHKLDTTLNVAGILISAQTVNVVSKLSGQVTGLNADTGAEVKSGDTLITLETKMLDAQLRQAEASLQSAQAALQAVRDKADLDKISLDAAQRAYDRVKELFTSSAGTQSQLDDASSNLDLKKKQYEISRGSAVQQAEASVKVAQSNIDNIKVQMENAVITSPINGIVINRNINPGEIASSGATLLTLADIATLKLRGTVSQEIVPLIQAGEQINVTVDIYPDKVYTGKIGSIGPMAVSTGEYFPIEISIPNSGDVKPGLSAHASLNISGQDSVIVPLASVVQNNGQSYVYIIKDSIAVKQTVLTGLKNDKEIQVLKGVEAGQRVAVTNVNNLFDNMPVQAD